MNFWNELAVHEERNRYNHLGLRCRTCGEINEADPDYIPPVPVGVRVHGLRRARDRADGG
jgi:hypothetical protein